MNIKGLIIGIGRMIKVMGIRIFHKNISLGQKVIIDFNSRLFVGKNTLNIGDNVYLRSINKGYQAGMPFPTTILIDVSKAYVKIGNNTRINGAYVHAQKSIIIGENCVIASGVNIIDSNGHDLYSGNRTNGRDIPKDIVIGNNVWIGINSIILKGSVLGDNCVVSAGSVVKGVYDANSLIMGNPAEVVKKIKI